MAEEEEEFMSSDHDGIEMPDFLVPETLEDDDKEIEYYARKLGINDEVDEWDDDLRTNGYAKIMKDITAGRRTVHDAPMPKMKAVRTEEEEAARRDFTGLLNRIAPSNFGMISARLRESFSSHPPEISVAMFTRCLTQRIFADAELPALFIDCYARALKEVPDALQPVIEKLNERESVNVKPFLTALGTDTVAFYGSQKQDEQLAQLAKVARQMHMNTDVRKNLFYAVTTAVDVVDAYTKIIKLQLSKTQRKDVPMVIIECCRKESSYNPFYAALSTHFAEVEKRFEKSIRVAIRNTMKLMPGFDVKQLRNVAMFCAELVQKQVINMGFLKGAKLMELGAQPLVFVKILFRELFSTWDRESVAEEMAAIAKMPNFATDVKRFLEKRFKPFMDSQEGVSRDRKALVTRAIDALAEGLVQ